MLAETTKEFERVAESVTQGELRARVPLDKASGGWGQQLRAMNNILAVFGKHAAEIRRVIKCVHTGDLARQVAVGPEAVHRGGELQRLAEDMNQMVTHVDRLTAEITRVLAEVGLDGRLNAQCHLSDASGSWALLVGSVNAASASLSEQVQDLCATATAIAAGNLAARASVTSRGDLQTLKLGLNGAAEGMFGLCSELRRIAPEVTNEGKLYGYVCVASFGWDSGSEAVRVTRVGEGLVGRVAAEGEPLVLEDIDVHGVRVRTSLIELVPRSVLIFPIKNESGVVAIIELGFVRGHVEDARELLAFVAADLARGARPAEVLDSASAAPDRTRALEEELVINSARLESMANELQQRDRSLRELQLELQRVRGVVSQPPGEAAAPRIQST